MAGDDSSNFDAVNVVSWLAHMPKTADFFARATDLAGCGRRVD